MRTLLVIVLVLLTVSPIELCAQSQADPSDPKFAKFVYEVVSIKPAKNVSGILSQVLPDGLTMQGVSLQSLVDRAYRIEDFQIAGVQDWMKSELFDIDAKMDEPVADAFKRLSTAEKTLARRYMLQRLLAERFNLKVHHETRQIPVYLLQVMKSGAKIREAKPQDAYVNSMRVQDSEDEGDGRMRLSLNPQMDVLTLQSAPIADLVGMLTFFSLGHPVLDKTGLSGKYSFTLTWNPETAVPVGESLTSTPDSAAPFIFTALKEQLGLELVSGKGDVDFIVIDHVERPDKN
ncbi:MAG TPA: TIGR03435 family protein [Candidatus Acidoferrales bacterium]|nr:TIGR03435 family protein [Candidatus Acidoferrales bacterium]